MKYKKKPVEIEAFQYDGDLIDSDGHYYVPSWAMDAHKHGVLCFEQGEMYVKTLEGKMHVKVGNYVIQGVNGELYSCDSEIFDKTYEPVTR